MLVAVQERYGSGEFGDEERVLEVGLKLCHAGVKKGQQNVFHSFAQPPKTKKLLSELRKSWDAQAFTQHPLPNGAAWASLPFALQAFVNADKYMFIGVAHFGMMEGRVLLSGKEVCYGLQLESVPGNNAKEKRAYVASRDTSWLHSSIDQGHGFITMHNVDELFIVPSGFMVVYIACGECTGLRWSISADGADVDRTMASLACVLAGYPELRNAKHGYQQYHDHLRDGGFF